ncbi:hypothetical protein RB608_24865 [Nocardioides sp. LHD-245]|uniref:hypothetical protein n=1 Tax=Nocardioides sp. LHD-245 TaxID=3051387 RepID=UPI0027DF46D0|nr:hypothetical protein [Nocardioides sp. LHD-245]
MTTDEARCEHCHVPLLVRADRTVYRPHLSWCLWAPRARPVVLLPRPAQAEPDDPPDTDDERNDER